MPDDGDEPQTSKAKKPKLLWNRFKWILFFANTLVSPLLRWIEREPRIGRRRRRQLCRPLGSCPPLPHSNLLD